MTGIVVNITLKLSEEITKSKRMGGPGVTQRIRRNSRGENESMKYVDFRDKVNTLLKNIKENKVIPQDTEAGSSTKETISCGEKRKRPDTEEGSSTIIPQDTEAGSSTIILNKSNEVKHSIIGYYAMFDESNILLNNINYKKATNTKDTDHRIILLMELNAWARILYQTLIKLNDMLPKSKVETSEAANNDNNNGTRVNYDRDREKINEIYTEIYERMKNNT